MERWRHSMEGTGIATDRGQRPHSATHKEPPRGHYPGRGMTCADRCRRADEVKEA
ncbi:MAG: hypothetical protein K2P06_05200 [Muribaculaceae bacterium]|nr:hypothetical protein [Muribaculaceae bacterium]